MILTRTIRIQLVIFTALTIASLVGLGWYYLRLPSLLGVGHYTLLLELPVAGGLYPSANITYGGATIGKVTEVRPTENGVRATLSIDDHYRIPVDVSANVHSLSAVGEPYLELVVADDAGPYLSAGQIITNATVPSPVSQLLDTAQRALDALPHDKIPTVLDETSRAVGGLGPILQQLVNSTQLFVSETHTNMSDIQDIIDNSAAVIDSQADSGEDIKNWSTDLATLAAQTAANDQTLRSVLSQAAPATDDVTELLSSVQESLPQVLGNVAIVTDMLKRYQAGVEQLLVVLPQGASIAQTVTTVYPGKAAMDFNLALNQPPPCLTGFLSPSQWRSPSDTSREPLPTAVQYCKIPKGAATAVRGARNYPCTDIPGKRAATPQECRSDQPYLPAGTNPWYGNPEQIRSCPAPGARCDQPVEPGRVIPAPTVNNGVNPLPADQLPEPSAAASDSLTPPGQGTIQCSGQQPNQCTYTPTSGIAAAHYDVSAGLVTGPDGVEYVVNNSTSLGDQGWKQMLSPAVR